MSWGSGFFGDNVPAERSVRLGADSRAQCSKACGFYSRTHTCSSNHLESCTLMSPEEYGSQEMHRQIQNLHSTTRGMCELYRAYDTLLSHLILVSPRYCFYLATSQVQGSCLYNDSPPLMLVRLFAVIPRPVINRRVGPCRCNRSGRSGLDCRGIQ